MTALQCIRGFVCVGSPFLDSVIGREAPSRSIYSFQSGSLIIDSIRKIMVHFASPLLVQLDLHTNVEHDIAQIKLCISTNNILSNLSLLIHTLAYLKCSLLVGICE